MKDYLKTMRQQGVQQQMQEAPPSEDKNYKKSFKEADRQVSKDIRFEEEQKRAENRRESIGKGRLDLDETIIYDVAKKYNLPPDVDKVNAKLNEYENEGGRFGKHTPELNKLKEDTDALQDALARDQDVSGSYSNLSAKEMSAVNNTLSQNKKGIIKYEKSLEEINQYKNPPENIKEPTVSVIDNEIPCVDNSVYIPPPELSVNEIKLDNSSPSMMSIENKITSALGKEKFSFGGTTGGIHADVYEATTTPPLTTPIAPVTQQQNVGGKGVK
jgi:hypothetical protein